MTAKQEVLRRYRKARCVRQGNRILYHVYIGKYDYVKYASAYSAVQAWKNALSKILALEIDAKG